VPDEERLKVGGLGGFFIRLVCAAERLKLIAVVMVDRNGEGLLLLTALR